MRTAIHVTALAAAIVVLFTSLAPASELLLPNPIAVLFGATEWNCSDQPRGHWCHKDVKHTRKSHK